MNLSLILKFLKDIKKNNDREWFEKNKHRYAEAKEQFEALVGSMLEEMIAFDDSLTGLEPKKLVFRIYRDVRFSKDKRPYKTNFGAGFSAAGKGMGKPGYYLQIEPGNSFAAVGLFQPVPEILAQVRQEIDYNGDKLKKIVNEKKFKTNFEKFWDEDALKSAPKGYAKDHPYAHWLRLKSFVVTHNFTDTEVTDAKFPKQALAILRSGKPLNDFLNEAIA
jgi:uncharacterized protein (TIGR02453 family)